MNKMEEIETIISLHKRIESAEKSLKMGKTHRDYLAIIYDAKEQLQRIKTNLKEGNISLRIVEIKGSKISFIIDNIETREEIGKAKIQIVKDKALLDYSMIQKYVKKNYDLIALKLLCQFMQRQGIKEVKTIAYKEETDKNCSLSKMGAKKDITKVRPYNEYNLKLK